MNQDRPIKTLLNLGKNTLFYLSFMIIITVLIVIHFSRHAESKTSAVRPTMLENDYKVPLPHKSDLSIELLSILNQPSFNKLLSAIKDQNPLVSYTAAWAMPWIDLTPPESVQLFRALKKRLTKISPLYKPQLLFALHALESQLRRHDNKLDLPIYPIFFEFSDHPDPYVRTAALFGLRLWDNQRKARTKLSSAGLDPVWLVRRSAYDYFSREAVINGFYDEDPEVRAGIFRTITMYYRKTPDDFIPLAIKSLNDPYALVTYEAIAWLGNMQIEKAVSPLLNLIEHNPEWKPWVDTALKKITGTHRDELGLQNTPYFSGNDPSSNEINQIDTDFHERILKQENVSTKIASTLQLAWAIDTKAINLLSHLLDNSDPKIRHAAAEAMGAYPLTNLRNTSKVLKALIKAAKEDVNALVRKKAVNGMGNFLANNYDLEVVQHLEELLISDKNPIVRLEATNALGQVRSTPTSKSLRSGLTDDFYKVRERAAVGVDLRCYPEAFNQTKKLLEDPYASVRAEAVRSLAVSQDPSTLRILVKSLYDANEIVRLQAAQGLGGLGQEKALPILEKVAQEDISVQVRNMAKQSYQLIRNSKVSSIPKIIPQSCEFNKS